MPEKEIKDMVKRTYLKDGFFPSKNKQFPSREIIRHHILRVTHYQNL